MSEEKDLGQRIARQRKAKHMSQRELAEAAQITEQALSRIETGLREPRVDTVRRLAVALGVGVGEIIEGSAAKRRQKSYRPDIEKLADLLAPVPHETVKLAHKIVEVLVEDVAARR